VDQTGGFTVVTHTGARTRLRLEGLPGGRYGISYTTSRSTGEALPDVEIEDGKPLEAVIPAAGVITVFSR
jgi:hypothetical protein